jgi:tetratricopeptide (TPR) repeat protein
MDRTGKQRNPYIAGRALGQDRGFIGREDVFELVETEMLSPDRNAVVLFGQRRIGKTSILLQLKRRFPSDLFLTVYFDLMDHAAKPLGNLLLELAKTIHAESGLAAALPAEFDDEGVAFRRDFLPQLFRALPEDRRPVLLLDEFDVLDASEERQLPPNAAARTFFPFLRRLMEEEPRLGFIFVVGRKAEDLSIDVKATFKAARYYRVSVLSPEAAAELILTAEKQQTLSFSEAAVKRILAYTCGHPYFTQLMCQLLWDRAYARNGSPKVEAGDVDAVAAKVPEAGENIFEWIWDGLPPAEKVICSAVAKGAPPFGAVSREGIDDILQKHGIRVMTRELELAPDALVKWEMLHMREGGYGYFTELIRRWVSERKPLVKVKDELDRVVPLAETLYQSGDGFYRRGNLESAQTLLEQALTVNPNHVKSRLLFGQVLIEQGRLADAIREFEEAYKYDEATSRSPLVRTLLVRSEELLRSGDEERALGACERVLQLSPQDLVATERRASIWMARGDRAMKAEQPETAMAAYEQIGAAEKINQAKALRKRLDVQDLTRQAAEATRAEQWQKVIDLYTQLGQLEPEEAGWRTKLDSAKNEQRQARIYAQAQEALQLQDHKKSQRLLLDLLHDRPDYKDAPQLLVEAFRVAPPKLDDGPQEDPLWQRATFAGATGAAATALVLAAGLVPLATSTIETHMGVVAKMAIAFAVLEVVVHLLKTTLFRRRVEPEEAEKPPTSNTLIFTTTPKESPAQPKAVAAGQKH